MRKKYLTTFLLIAIVIFIYPLYSLTQLERVNSTTINKQLYSDSFEISGVVEPNFSVDVSLSYPVYIKECLVTDNSFINKGQLIFVLDKERMLEALKTKNATDLYDETTDVYASINSESLYAISENIYATESGIITDISAQTGSFIMQGYPLCNIRKNDECIVKISVSQDDYSRIMVGDSLLVSPLIAQDKTYNAKITAKTATVRKELTPLGSKTVVDIYARISEPDEYIIAGLDLTGRIIDRPEKEIYTLPYEYVFQDDNGEYVNILIDGNPQKIYIKTGAELDEDVEILSVFPEKTLFLNKDNIKKDKVLISD